MPEISRFFGLVIRMFYLDHEPPHFHAAYSGVEAVIRIEPICLLKGNLPPRVFSLAVEWANLHQGELLENWLRLRADELPLKIAPLE